MNAEAVAHNSPPYKIVWMGNGFEIRFMGHSKKLQIGFMRVSEQAYLEEILNEAFKAGMDYASQK